MKTMALVTTLLLLLASVALAAPTAVAHSCRSSDRSACNPDGCVDGEDHHHVHDRTFQEDEFCQTSRVEEKCVFNGIEFPMVVCRLIGGAGVPAAAKAPKLGQKTQLV